LARDYAGEWIAVSDIGVVGHAKTRERLRSFLEKKRIGLADVYIDLMSGAIFVR
jgi:hypothetical protein